MFNQSYRCVFKLLMVTALILGGCGTSKPARFYTLSPLSDPASATSVTALSEIAAIGVGPVKLPQYLNQPQIVTRVSPNRFEFAEFDRWGGDLKDDFTRTLAENLTHLMPSIRVSRYPWRSKLQLDYRIHVEVIRFDGQPGNSIVLNVQWQIVTGDGDTQLVSRRSSFVESMEGTGYDAMVAAQSRTIDNLAREIAGVLQGLERKVPVQ